MIYSSAYDYEIANLSKVEGAYVPKNLYDMKLIYGDMYSDERIVQRIEAGGPYDDSFYRKPEPVHWGMGHLAHRWLRDRNLVDKYLGRKLEEIDFSLQWENVIFDARAMFNVDQTEKWRSSNDKPVEKVESADEKFDKWMAEKLPLRFASVQLDKFEGCEDLANHIMGGGSALIIGPTGTKKSSFLWALAKHIASNTSPEEVIVTNMQEMLSWARGSNEWVSTLEREFGKVTWLLIDEVDKINGSANDITMVSALINSRYENKLPTVCAGNSRNLADARRKLGDAVVSRLIASKENGMLFSTEGQPDLRI